MRSAALAVWREHGSLDRYFQRPLTKITFTLLHIIQDLAQDISIMHLHYNILYKKYVTVVGSDTRIMINRETVDELDKETVLTGQFPAM